MLNFRQLTGLDSDHVEPGPDNSLLHVETTRGFDQLRTDAAAAGFDLRIISGFRSFHRQLSIWNAKASGQRSVHNDQGVILDYSSTSSAAWVEAILRYSALPGASRHHWGSDMDVYDADAVEDGYQVQLSPQEVAPGGVFDPLHGWLDGYLSSQNNPGFYRPFDIDRGGVAPERWHLSYGPLAASCQGQLSVAVVEESLADCGLILADIVLSDIQSIYTRYIELPEPSIPGFI